MTNDSIDSKANWWTRDSSRNATACMPNMIRNTLRRPIASDSQAHKKRPEPLAIEISPTIPAAVAVDTPEISCAIGDACEMIEIPAVVFRNKVSQSAYHCHVPSACRSVKSCDAGLTRCAAVPLYPAGA